MFAPLQLYLRLSLAASTLPLDDVSEGLPVLTFRCVAVPTTKPHPASRIAIILALLPSGVHAKDVNVFLSIDGFS